MSSPNSAASSASSFAAVAAAALSTSSCASSISRATSSASAAPFGAAAAPADPSPPPSSGPVPFATAARDIALSKMDIAAAPCSPPTTGPSVSCVSPPFVRFFARAFVKCSVLKLPAWIAKWSSSRFCMDFCRMFSSMVPLHTMR